jgi:hypothetical protein
MGLSTHKPRPRPIGYSFHEDPHEGCDGYGQNGGGPAGFEESACMMCDCAVGGYLGDDDDYGRGPRAEWTSYLAIELTDGTYRFYCEDCAEPAYDMAEVIRRELDDRGWVTTPNF